jgi:hypothetical protein
MGWNAITEQDVIPDGWAEKQIIDDLNVGDALGGVIENVIGEVRGYVMAGNYPLGPDGTIPDALRSDAIAIARWRFFLTIPKNEQLQSSERKDDFNRAMEKLKLVAQQKFAVEVTIPPVNPATGTWNSENKLLPRTHPVPPPATQFQSTDSTARPYANPDGPQDT